MVLHAPQEGDFSAEEQVGVANADGQVLDASNLAGKVLPGTMRDGDAQSAWIVLPSLP